MKADYKIFKGKTDSYLPTFLELIFPISFVKLFSLSLFKVTSDYEKSIEMSTFDFLCFMLSLGVLRSTKVILINPSLHFTGSCFVIYQVNSTQFGSN